MLDEEGFPLLTAVFALCGIERTGFSPPQPLITIGDKPSILDPVAYPNVLDTIIAHADHKTHLALWGTSKALYHHLNSHFYRHIAKRCRGVSMSGRPGKLPVIYKGWRLKIEVGANVGRHCRLFDIEGTCHLDGAASQLETATNAVAVRTWNYFPFQFTLDAFGGNDEAGDEKGTAVAEGGGGDDAIVVQPLSGLTINKSDEQSGSGANSNGPAPTAHSSDCNCSSSDCGGGDNGPHITSFYEPAVSLPETVILKAAVTARSSVPDDWACVVIFLPVGLPDGPTRIVLNISYTWTAQLFAAFVGPTDLPPSVTELVIHFKQDDKERPRYMVCEDANYEDGHSGHRCIEPLGLDSPIPEVKENQHLDIIHHLDPPGGIDIFQQLAKLCAPAVGNGKLKVTLVGVDEFDAARDADAAGDDAFGGIIDQLPWGHAVPPREAYANQPYQPVAPTLVDRFAQLVGKKKRAKVARGVKVLSRDEYLASVGAQRRYEEDWWADEFVTPCRHRPPSEVLSEDV